MFWKILPAVVISLAALNVEALACWDDGPPLGYYPETSVFFQEGLYELKAIPPLCGPSDERASYPKDELIKHYQYDSRKKAQEETLADWFAIIESLQPGEAGQEALLELIAKSTPEDLRFLQTAFGGAALEGPLSGNLAAQAIVASGNQAALDYLVFTRDLTTPGLFGYPDGQWGYAKKQDAEPTKEIFAELAARGEAAYKIPDLPPQLRMLYAFQLIRIYFYAGEHDRVIVFFENDLAHKPASATLEWCRSYYGGSLHARGRNVEAFAAFAAVFHRSARYGHSAFNSLYIVDWPLSRDREQSTSNKDGPVIYSEHEQQWLQAATPEDAALYRSARNYIGGDPHEALAAVLSLIEHGGRAPRNLEEYLVTAVGRMERKAYRPGDIYRWGSKADPPPAPDPDLERQLLKVGAERPHPALWQLAAAHLAIMRRDEKAAAAYIDMAEANQAESVMPLQLQTTRLLKDAWLKPLDAANERRLATGFAEFDLLLTAHDRFHSSFIARHALWESVLARRYQEEGQDVRAFFCLEVVSTRLYHRNAAQEEGQPSTQELESVEDPVLLRWAREYIATVLSSPANLKEIRRITLKPRGNLELYFQKNPVGWTPQIIDELTGLAYINRFDYQRAIEVLRGSSAQGWAQRRYKEKTPLAPSPGSPKQVSKNLSVNSDIMPPWRASQEVRNESAIMGSVG